MSETPTTFEAGELAFSMSPTVKALKYAGEAARPRSLPISRTAGSSTTLTRWRSVRSYHMLPTIPELRGERPESSTEWPGPVSVQAWR